MRRLAIVFAAAAVVLAVAAPALAKGPAGATITGPGIDEPIVLSGVGEYSAGTHFSRFVEATGLWELAFEADFSGTGLGITTNPPTKDLGDVYEVTWDMGDGTIIAMAVYPFATGGAVTYVKPDVEIEGWGMRTHGGWFRTTDPLTTYLEEYGVPMPPAAATEITAPVKTPKTPPTTTAAVSPAADVFPAVPVVTAAALALLALAGLWVARRPRRVAAP